MDFPAFPAFPRERGVISTWLSMSLAGHGTGNLAASSTTWPAANRALFVPFRLVEPFLIRQMFHHNGATVSGNIDVGIYDAKGTRLISSGSTAQAGTSVLQIFNVTDTWLGSGLFYFAAAMDNGTGTLTRHAHAWGAALGCVQQASAFPLPATATFAAYGTGFIPVLGATGKTVI